MSYHGSNSWMIDSNLMTANSLDANPTTHARDSTTNTIKDLEPALAKNPPEETDLPEVDDTPEADMVAFKMGSGFPRGREGNGETLLFFTKKKVSGSFWFRRKCKEDSSLVVLCQIKLIRPSVCP